MQRIQRRTLIPSIRNDWNENETLTQLENTGT